MTTNVQRYSFVAILLHWVTALLILYMLIWGEGLIKGEPLNKVAPSNPSLHASLGIIVLALTIARLAWRLVNPPPPDVPMSALQAKLSHALHWGMYALLVLIPLSGIAALEKWFTRHTDISSLSFFDLFTIPQFSFPLFGSTHELLTKLMWGLFGLHVLAALKHQFFDKDKLLNRMSLH